VAAFKVLLVPFDAEGVIATDNALADDTGGTVANGQEVLVIKVPIKLFV